MSERIALGKNSFVVQSPTTVGLYRDGDRALLIDSGNDISAGRRLLKMLDEMGLRLKAVVTTHHHADHIGGNAVLQQRTGCEILGVVLNSVTFDSLSSKHYYHKSYYTHYDSDYYKPPKKSASGSRKK